MTSRILAALLIAAAGVASAQQPAPDESSPPPSEAQAGGPAPVPALEASPTTDEAPVAPVPIPQAAPPAPKPVAQKPPAPPEKPPEPPKPVRSPVAIIQALDKVTAETLRFAAPVGRRVRYKSLIFTVKACETAGPDDPQPRTSAYLLIESQPPTLPGQAPPEAKQVFKGWMFAVGPGLHPFEHPVYDAWLIACSATMPVA